MLVSSHSSNREDLELDVPKDHKVLFPSMKKITLAGIQLGSSCTLNPPVLPPIPSEGVKVPAQLVLEELCFTRHFDSLRRINVSSTSLKRLRIYACCASRVNLGCEAVDTVYEFDEVDEVDAFDEVDEVNHSNMRIFPNLVKLVIDMISQIL
ncbi:hypothetical protein Tco_0339976 [Tanacetum coccineum]